MSVTASFARALPSLAVLRRLRDRGAAGQARQAVSLVSAGTCLTGSIDAVGSLRVEGRLEGDVRVQGAVEVVKGASILGTELRCRDLLVGGLVEANVQATGSVTIVAGGRIQGDLHCRDLQAPRGAQLQGRITLGDQPEEQGVHKRLAVTPDLQTSSAAVDGFQ